jgi:hypothetical protein
MLTCVEGGITKGPESLSTGNPSAVVTTSLAADIGNASANVSSIGTELTVSKVRHSG